MSPIRPIIARSSLEPRHVRLLLLLGAASFFEGYDLNIITVALKPLRTTFGLGQAAASLWIAVIYLGALPAVPAARWADRRGRRVLLLASMLGYTVATAVTAFAPDIGSFAAVQFVARFLLVLQSALAWTVVAEELPAAGRGLGSAGWPRSRRSGRAGPPSCGARCCTRSGCPGAGCMWQPCPCSVWWSCCAAGCQRPAGTVT